MVFLAHWQLVSCILVNWFLGPHSLTSANPFWPTSMMATSLMLTWMLNLPVCRWSKSTRPESGASLVVGISASSMGSVWARPKAISVSDISSIFQLKPVLSGHEKNLCWMDVCSSWRCDRNWAGRWVWWPYLKVLLCWATLREEDFLSWFKNNIIVLQNKQNQCTCMAYGGNKNLVM